MIRAVIDTNVLASGVLGRPDTPPAQIIDAWRSGLFQLVLSRPLLSELDRTLANRYFRSRISADQASRFIELMAEEAEIIEIREAVEGVATHPEDDVIVATAVSAAAQFLVTGDRPLQGIGTYRDVTIVSPRQFIEMLATSSIT